MKKNIFFFLSLLYCSFSFGQNSANLSGHFVNSTKNTIKCVLLLNSVTRETKTLEIPVVNGIFKHLLEVNKSTYLYITDGENYFNGLIDPGDSIIIKFDTSNADNPFTFEGKGKEKFQFLNLFLQAKIYKKLVNQTSTAKSQKFPFDYMFHYIDSAENKFIHQLDSLKNSMSNKSYSLLLGDIKGSFLGNRNRSIGLIYHEPAEVTIKNRQKELTPTSKSIMQNIMKFNSDFSYSQTYVQEVYNILSSNYEYRVVTNKASNNILIKYNYFENSLPKNLKTPVLTLFLEPEIKKLNNSEHIEKLIQKTYRFSKDSSYKNYIVKKYKDAKDISNFKKGMQAPDFMIEKPNGDKISLASFKGKVIHIDFWYAACGPCHLLFETLKPVKEYFSSDSNVVFLNISIDLNDIWKKSLIKYDIKGYNAYTENQTSEHPIIKAYKVGGYPTTCLIDKKGNIFNANPSNIAEELKKQIEDVLKVE